MVIEHTKAYLQWLNAIGKVDTKNIPPQFQREYYLSEWFIEHGDDIQLKHDKSDGEAFVQQDKCAEFLEDKGIMGLFPTDKDGFIRGIRPCAIDSDREIYRKLMSKYPLAFRKE